MVTRTRHTRPDCIVNQRSASKTRDNERSAPVKGGNSIGGILDSSLRRLGVENIDLYWLHRDSPGYPVEEILESLEAFRKAGKIKYAGFSNWTQLRAEEARLAAERLGQGFVASQQHVEPAKPDLSKVDPTWAFIDESFVRWHIEHGHSAFALRNSGNVASDAWSKTRWTRSRRTLDKNSL